VNTTIDTFAALGVEDTHLELSVPTQHAFPTTDPAVPRSSCGVGAPGLPGLENCGYDGAGAMFQFFFADLKPPAPNATADPANVVAFDQSAMEIGGVFSGFASTGYAYIPRACAGGRSPCILHVAFHGCGQDALLPSVNLSFVLHAGYAQWADANHAVILFPQMGGYAERNITAPAAQLAAGCWDGYGQTGPAYAWRGGPQMAGVAALVREALGSRTKRAAPIATGAEKWRWSGGRGIGGVSVSSIGGGGA